MFQSNGLDLSEENIDLKPENHNVHVSSLYNKFFFRLSYVQL